MKFFIFAVSFAFILLFVIWFSEFLIEKSEKKKPVKEWQELFIKGLIAAPLCTIWCAFSDLPEFNNINSVSASFLGCVLAFGFTALKFFIYLFWYKHKSRGEINEQDN